MTGAEIQPLSQRDTGWGAIFEVIEHGWGKVPVEAEDTYAALLAGRTVDEILTALQALAEEGFKYRPRPPDILRKLNADPGKPTFEEAYQLIFGRGGVLRARPRQSVFRGAGERARATDTAALERAAELHPYVAAFVRTVGLTYLRQLPIEDPEWGFKRREELQDAWSRFVMAADERVAAGRSLDVMGRRAEIGPRRLDPLGALGLGRAPELTPGEEQT